jgi:two-component system chemotaxis response regulator CheY
MNLVMPSLLITDDDRDFRETLRGLFEERGYRTLVAGDGDEAVRIVQEHPVHLMLLDMHMPRLSGLDAIRQIRKLPCTTPFILLSAALTDGVIAEARTFDPFSILSKPVRLAEVTSKVRQALEQFYHFQ